MKTIIDGYVSFLYEWEDAGVSLFNEKTIKNQYNYNDNPKHDIMQVLEKYAGKNVKIIIEEI